MNTAQTNLEATAKRISQTPASPSDMVDLLSEKDQFETGTKLVHTEDQMTGTLLNMLG
jgi:cellobiose-specific phosphotransferase system component IIA